MFSISIRNTSFALSIRRCICLPVSSRLNTLSGVVALAAASSSWAATCPFDTPTASLTREGLVLSRYASGLTGNALVANSGFAATDATTIQANIVAMSDLLDINRNGSVDVTDATIISRKIAGFDNAAATAGIPAANLGPGGASAVNSFLLSGCGGVTAWKQGGNAFGAPGILGTTDAQPIGIVSGDNVTVIAKATTLLIGTEASPKGGFTIFEPTANATVATLNGAWTNSGLHAGATIAGGGGNQAICDEVEGGPPTASCANEVNGEFGTISGGRSNSAAVLATVGGGERNQAIGSNSAIAGGRFNRADASSAAIAGGRSNLASGSESAIGGGASNTASGDNSSVSGGWLNRATGTESTVAGGKSNWASGARSIVAGGDNNSASGSGAAAFGGSFNAASGQFSLALGVRAKANQNGSFVWGGSVSTDTDSSGVGTFTAYAPGGFFFYRGNPGAGGCTLPAGTVSWSCTSDRNTKTNITNLNTSDILRRVLAMPVTRWSYKGTEHVNNIGPMAQDFWRAFGLGDSDKTIASMNMSGVALAAIQGLHQVVAEKDRKIEALEARLKRLETAITSRVDGLKPVSKHSSLSSTSHR